MFTRNHATELANETSHPSGFEPENQPAVRPRYLPDGRGVLLFVVRQPAPDQRVLASDERIAAPLVEPAKESSFERFLYAMTSVALEAGNTRVAAALPTLLRQGRLKAASLGKSAERALRSRGYMAADGDAASPSLLEAATAWRSVLEGEPADLAACGAQTLDEWGGALLAALLGEGPGRAEELKKLLRKSGVLAFGMRAAA